MTLTIPIATFQTLPAMVWTAYLAWRKPFSILVRRKVSKRVRRAFFVKEADIIGYLFQDVLR